MSGAIRHLLVDRDGVLNVEQSAVRSRADWAWIPGSLEALVKLHRAGVRVSVVTNQAAIGRGEVAAEAVEALHAALCAEVAQAGGHIGVFFVCPHAPEDGCGCRKPRPGLVEQAIAASKVPAASTLMVGDMARDLEAGQGAGVRVALVRTGKGRATEEAWRGPPLTTYDDLAALVDAVGVAEPVR